jgi:hypothetical protein
MSSSEIAKIKLETEKIILSYNKRIDEINVLKQKAIDDVAHEKNRADTLSQEIEILNKKFKDLINNERKEAYESGNSL